MRVPAIEGGSPVRSEMLPFSPPDIGSSEIARVTDVLKSGWITRGKVCEELERRISDYTGARFAHCLNSATAGLFLSLKIAGIGEGDEVITTPYTFAASANVIVHTGAKPVLADVEDDGFQISPQETARKVTPRTRAVIPVHFGGHPVDLDAIREIAKTHGFLVVEDAAHAIGAEYHGTRIGDGKNPCVFSFHAVKNVTTAEGGCVLTNDEKFHKALRLFSLHGQTKDAHEKLRAGGWQYDITVPGYKFNLTDLHAAVGVEQLKRVEAITKKRERIAERYTALLKEYDFVRTPSVKKGHRSSWHLYPILIDFSRLAIDRDRFITALAAENISANVHYIPVHLMSFYRKTFGYNPEDFPVAYSLFQREVSLPIYPQLSFDDVDRVGEAVGKLFDHYMK
jgi:dTDP-4-amino-4,6-dideoxygalactose transaminase